MESPDDRKYSESHIWAKADGARVTLGITAYAADEMGDIIYLELPEVGAELKAGEACGSIESAKAIEDIISPIDGKVIERNDEVIDAPEGVTEDAFGKGWLLVIEASDPSQLDGLLSASEYEEKNT